MVIGAVAALGVVLVAPPASSGENGNGNKSLDPPGVDVPGWEAEKVSGEAVGCHSEIELDLDLSVFEDAGSGATTTDASTAVTNLLSGLNVGDRGWLNQLLPEVQQRLDASLAEVDAADEDGEESLFHEEAGPVPTVKLPWQGGGPVVEEEDDCTMSLFGFIHIPLATDLRVESEGLIGPAGYAHTESESHDNLGLVYVADKVDTECLATLEDIDAKTSIEDGEYFDLDDFEVKDIPEDPDENEELTDVEFQDSDGPFSLNFEFSLTANEQEETDKAVDVTGLHSELLLEIAFNGQNFLVLTIDGIRDWSHCDIHPIQTHVTPADVVVVEPKFTG
jgi:hypothetical protein